MKNKETLEEVFKKTYFGGKISFDSDIGKAFELGAKWQQEQNNTANEILDYILTNDDGVGIALGYNSREMIEQYFKNKGYEKHSRITNR